MDEESEYSEREVRPKMSMTPSWVMLGFVLGALFVVALPQRKPAPPAAPPKQLSVPPRQTETRAAPPQLSTIEAVFSMWGEYAIWHDNRTEVALWNPELNRFADYYEVRRFGDILYFRTIPKFTRRVIQRGKPMPECPLQFTETEEQYREWQEHGRTERRQSSDGR